MEEGFNVLAALSTLLLVEITSPPRFAFLPSSTEQSALTMQCEGKPPYKEIKCKFIEASLAVPTEAEIQKKLAEKKKKVAAVAGKKIAETKKEICSSLSEWRTEKESVPSRQTDLREHVASMEAACRCGTEDCVIEELLKIEERDLRTCAIRTQWWDEKLQRTSSNSWVATHGPTGSCGNVEVMTLECDPKDGPPFCTFTWVRASSNKSDPLCAGLETNKPSVWSWKTWSTFHVDTCLRFKMG